MSCFSEFDDTKENFVLPLLLLDAQSNLLSTRSIKELIKKSRKDHLPVIHTNFNLQDSKVLFEIQVLSDYVRENKLKNCINSI